MDLQRRGRRIRAVAPTAFAGAIAMAAACSSGGSVGPPAPFVPGTADHPRDVNVILRDYVFVPTPILLVPGETVRFMIIDGGLVEHEFVLGPQQFQDAYERAEAAVAPTLPGATEPPVSLPPAMVDLGLRVVVGSGQQASVVYHVPASGPVPLLECHLPGHLAKGMVGAIDFVPPGATGP